MRRLILFLVLFVAACNGTSTPISPPSSITPTAASLTQTSLPPTTIPDTPIPSPIPPTATPASTTTFPDPKAYTWQMIISGLQRPVDLQPDGSGRLFVIKKPERIRIIENDQLIETPFFFFNDPATTEIYTLSLHDALPISARRAGTASLGRSVSSVPIERLPGVHEVAPQGVAAIHSRGGVRRLRGAGASLRRGGGGGVRHGRERPGPCRPADRWVRRADRIHLPHARGGVGHAQQLQGFPGHRGRRHRPVATRPARSNRPRPVRVQKLGRGALSSQNWASDHPPMALFILYLVTRSTRGMLLGSLRSQHGKLAGRRSSLTCT